MNGTDADTVRAALEDVLNGYAGRTDPTHALAALDRLSGRVADAEKALQGVRLHVDAISILARSPYPTEHAFAAGMLRIAELAALSGAVEAGVAQNSWRERAADAEKALAELWDWLGSDQRSTPLALERQVKAALSRLPEAE